MFYVIKLLSAKKIAQTFANLLNMNQSNIRVDHYEATREDVEGFTPIIKSATLCRTVS